MSRVRVLSLSVAAVVVVVAIAYGVALLTSDDTTLAQRLADVAPADTAGATDTSSAIAFWEQRLRENPQAVADRVELGRAYVRLAREEGDLAAYGRAEAVLREAMRLSPPNPRPRPLLSSVLIAQHAFTEARDLAQPIADNPIVPQALVSLGDAELALGNLDAAAAVYEQLSLREPGPVALSREAAIREARGDWEHALATASEAAVAAADAGLTGEARAWCELQVAELSLEYGRTDDARRAYLAALGVFPGYGFALAGLGRLGAATGDYDEAVEFLTVALERSPGPTEHALLGDVYAAVGDEDKAAGQYEAVEQIGRRDAEGTGLYRHELAHFYADHEIRPEEALELALTDLELRQDAEAYDLAAWAMFRADRLDEAQDFSERALASGTRAPSVLYHAGLIANAQGRFDEAQDLLEEALEINPAFDLLQAPRAADTLASLRDR